MNYELFVKLYSEALDYGDVDLYIAERGWQDWMENFEDVGNVLKRIYALANGELVDNRQSISPSRVKFCRLYNVPLRTVENWEHGKSPIPEHTKMLIDYSLLMSELYG